MYRKIVFCFLLLACESAQQGSPVQDAGETLDLGRTEFLICHNPASTEHGKECSEKCLDSKKESSAYCWPITRGDCQLDLGMSWQEENCHFFE